VMRAFMPLFVSSCDTKILEPIFEESFFERFFTSDCIKLVKQYLNI
jgi:hypothetical protein